MIRILLPFQLRMLAHIEGEVKLELEGEATQRSVFDALEARYPMLRGTLRDHVTEQRTGLRAAREALGTVVLAAMVFLTFYLFLNASSSLDTTLDLELWQPEERV